MLYAKKNVLCIIIYIFFFLLPKRLLLVLSAAAERKPQTNVNRAFRVFSPENGRSWNQIVWWRQKCWVAAQQVDSIVQVIGESSGKFFVRCFK